MPFTPPTFKDLGKKAKDVLSKKYDYRHELKSVNKAQEGVTLEAGSSFVKGLDTYVKGGYKDGSFGEAEAQIHTAAGPKDTNASVKFNKFFDGASVTINASTVPSLGLDASYSQDMIACTLAATNSEGKSGLDLSACFGMDGISAGTAVSLDGGFGVKSIDFGGEFRYGKTHAALKTSKGQKSVQFSLYNSLCKNMAVGAALNYCPAKSDYAIALGTDYTLDSATALKAKVTLTGVASFVVEHKVKDLMKLTTSAELDATKLGAPANKFGMAIVFGDY